MPSMRAWVPVPPSTTPRSNSVTAAAVRAEIGRPTISGAFSRTPDPSTPTSLRPHDRLSQRRRRQDAVDGRAGFIGIGDDPVAPALGGCTGDLVVIEFWKVGESQDLTLRRIHAIGLPGLYLVSRDGRLQFGFR